MKDNNNGWGYISDTIPELSMAILPECRGMGIGTKLLEKIIEDNRQKYPQISLSVDPQNEAMKLYKRLGFRECGVSGTSITMILGGFMCGTTKNATPLRKCRDLRFQ